MLYYYNKYIYIYNYPDILYYAHIIIREYSPWCKTWAWALPCREEVHGIATPKMKFMFNVKCSEIYPLVI